MDHFDIVIRGGTIVDGTGTPGRPGDVAISGDRIVAVGDVGPGRAELEIDATGRTVSPGFIDAHTHDDRLLLSDPDMSAKVSQGVTTVVVGNCGVSLAPFVPTGRPPPPLDLLGVEWFRFPTFGAYLDELDAKPAAANGVFLIGHQTLRVREMADLDRTATDDEIARMRGHVTEALQAGATGFSTGLFYPPARAASTDEVVAIAEALQPFGGLYATHMRDEGAGLEQSVEETLEIGRRAEVPVVISHHKASGLPNHGKVEKTLLRIAEAAKSQRVSLDVYPYSASSTVLLPGRLNDATRVIVTWSEKMPEVAGRDLDDIAAEHGVDKFEMASRLVPAGAIYFTMSEDDVQRVLRFAGAMIGSDGLPHDPRPHPRLWGTFPRVLGHYSRDLGLMPLEEAVRRMTGLTAAKFGIKDRGVLRVGAFADVTVFDPATVIDAATFEDPIRPSPGIDIVLVNGQPVWRDGVSTGVRSGRALRRDGPIA
ncbi:N-acyl-D-amino-acid deacylase [Constrictibacter sp. MBR-5]|jgi:N-acyl-D-amino-acid deacylase|uniref:N-acyl-D-amino-acid deacylase family protein n=1 Tax=Constrictibacter sp. MBR-5 TaxID=3156467 RepID=UPI00339495B5